jgi:hypothetical protein
MSVFWEKMAAHVFFRERRCGLRWEQDPGIGLNGGETWVIR